MNPSISILNRFWTPTWAQVGAKLATSWIQNRYKMHVQVACVFNIVFDCILDALGVDFGSVLASKIDPRSVSKLKRPMCTKLYYLQYETMVIHLPRGSKFEGKSMPKRLQDKIGFQEAKNHDKVSNIGSSWSPRSSQDASKSKLKTRCILSGQKQESKCTNAV